MFFVNDDDTATPDSEGYFRNVTVYEDTDPPGNTDPVARDDVFSGDQEVAIAGNVLADNGNGVDSDPTVILCLLLPGRTVRRTALWFFWPMAISPTRLMRGMWGRIVLPIRWKTGKAARIWRMSHGRLIVPGVATQTPSRRMMCFLAIRML